MGFVPFDKVVAALWHLGKDGKTGVRVVTITQSGCRPPQGQDELRAATRLAGRACTHARRIHQVEHELEMAAEREIGCFSGEMVEELDKRQDRLDTFAVFEVIEVKGERVKVAALGRSGSYDELGAATSPILHWQTEAKRCNEPGFPGSAIEYVRREASGRLT